jgi:hypothetical protein
MSGHKLDTMELTDLLQFPREQAQWFADLATTQHQSKQTLISTEKLE